MKIFTKNGEAFMKYNFVLKVKLFLCIKLVQCDKYFPCFLYIFCCHFTCYELTGKRKFENTFHQKDCTQHRPITRSIFKYPRA